MDISPGIARVRRIVVSPHFWAIVVLFAVITISHFHELVQHVPVLGHISTSVVFGMERHTEDRLLYILLVAYAGWIFGVRAGAIVLALATTSMVVRAAVISETPVDVLVETFTALLIGVLLLSLLWMWRRLLRDRATQEAALGQMRRSEENYRKLFQDASDAIWVHDLRGTITAANRAAAHMTGYSEEELLGMNVTQLLSQDAHELARRVKGKLMKSEPVEERYDQRVLRRDGTEAIVELTTRLIEDGEEPVAFHNIARDVTEERKMRDSMRFYLQKVLVAQEEERKRIACDLHDDAGQSLLVLTHRLDAIVSDPKIRLSEQVRQRLSQLHALAVETLGSLRRYAQELRPAILDDMGLAAALEWLADNLVMEDGIKADVQLDMPEQELSREAQLTLFRIAQEALFNIKKHAEASRVVIRLESGPAEVRMTVSDDGRGFNIPAHLGELSNAGKLGLVGMQERAQLLRGTLDIRSGPGRGTDIIVEIPLEG